MCAAVRAVALILEQGVPAPIAAEHVEVAAQTATVAEAAVGPVTPAPAEEPQIGSFGFDTTGMDTTVVPGNNFYEFANGTWAKNTPIPADKSNYGMFTKLDDSIVEEELRRLEAVYRMAETVAPTDSTVLIQGRSRDRVR